MVFFVYLGKFMRVCYFSVLGTCTSLFLSVDGIQVTATLLEVPPVSILQENISASITIIDIVESMYQYYVHTTLTHYVYVNAVQM